MNAWTMTAEWLAQGPPVRQPSGAASFFPIALMVAVVAFMLLTARSQKKREKRERDEMHARLTKNDRVLTIGGVLGTVVSVRDEEVVVKVDESTNTKMTFTKISIQRIVSDSQTSKERR